MTPSICYIYSSSEHNWHMGVANPWFIIGNWAIYLGYPNWGWSFGPDSERPPEEPNIPSLVGAGLESFADPKVASDFLQEAWGYFVMNFLNGPDEYRRLSANWSDRSKAAAFVAQAPVND